MLSIQRLSISEFINLSKKEQRKFMETIDIKKLKKEGNFPLLKKVIAMKVLMEARYAAGNQSIFDITSQFRNLIAFLGFHDPKMNAEIGAVFKHWPHKRPAQDSNEKGIVIGDPSEWRTKTNGYRLSHTSTMGAIFCQQKFFNVGVDDKMDITTQLVRNDSGTWILGSIITWEIQNRDQLSALFDTIRKEATYENTFGYDLFCAGMFCANQLLMFSADTSYLLLPVALILNLAINAAIIPPALTFIALEYMLINPIRWAINAITPNENQEFIDTVTAPSFVL